MRFFLLPFFLLFSISGFAQKSLLNNVPSQNLRFIKNTDCSSSSERFFIENNKDSIFYTTHKIYQTADGNLLVAGESQKNTVPFINQGFLMKCDDKGNVLWAKVYDSINHIINKSTIYYHDVIELQDGSILLAGGTYNLISQNTELIITKVNSTGNLIWSKVFKSRLWKQGSSSSNNYFMRQMKQDPYTGAVFLTGEHWAEGRSIIKLDPASGNIMWSKLYQAPFNGAFDVPFGIDIRANELRSFGKFSGRSNNNSYLGIYRINKITGDTLQTKYLVVTDTAGPRVGFIAPNPLTVLSNGNYILSGGLLGYNQFNFDGITPFYHAGITELDSNLNFVKAYCFRNRIQSHGNLRIKIYPDGSGLFTMINNISGYISDVYYAQFKNEVILKKRVKRYSGEGVPYLPEAVRLPDGGDLLIKLIGDSMYKGGKTEFLKLHISDTSSACLGTDEALTFIQPVAYGRVTGRLDSIGSNDFLESINKSITALEIPPFFNVPSCKQVSLCDSLQLMASANILCPSMPLRITVRKNPACGTPVIFNYDSSRVQSFTLLNDTTYSVVFNSAWQGYIYGSLGGCNNNFDSVRVNIIQSPSVFSLGPDSILCPGNTILLNAKKGFASYLWQDGSTDSTFTVTQPGTYFVKTTNACGGIFFDTVIVSPHPPIPFDIGPDLSKCNGDSLTITAPAGFINYIWTPAYNINSTKTQTVKLYPAVDTMYKVKAEKTPGCFAYDSVRIKVYTSPKIHLGADKSLCSGDSLILNAGIGFNKYLWSTGSLSQQIIVKNAGTYSITATTIDNCSSKDTLMIFAVNPNPIVTLDHDSTLCAGTSRVLNAGNFTSYLWNTGNASQTISVNNMGVYSVTVTDNNNCKASDTTKIVTILSSPSNFLPADTAVCSYSSLQLYSKIIYSKYLWNTNALTPAITITQPGVYWLQVSDKNNCSGRDSINVAQKDCMKGFFIPNAFSPNHDGKNDLFRPMLFGKVMLYEFTLYNHWGEIVFKSTDVNNGWDGSYKKLPQDNFVFVWTCKYQFENEPVKTERGSVLLLR